MPTWLFVSIVWALKVDGGRNCLMSRGWLLMSTWLFSAFSGGECSLEGNYVLHKYLHIFSTPVGYPHSSCPQSCSFFPSRSLINKPSHSLLSINPYTSLLQATSVHKVGDQIHSPEHCPLGEVLLLLALRDTAEWDHHVAGLNFWYIATSELNHVWTKLAPFLPPSVVNWGRKASDTVDGIGVYVVYCCLLGLSCPILDTPFPFYGGLLLGLPKPMNWWAWKNIQLIPFWLHVFLISWTQ